MKPRRQAQIMDVIDTRQSIHRKRCANAFSNAVSTRRKPRFRDLKDLGLVKRAGDGGYVRPGASPGHGAVADQLRRAVSTLMRSLERVD